MDNTTFRRSIYTRFLTKESQNSQEILVFTGKCGASWRGLPTYERFPMGMYIPKEWHLA